MGKTFKATYWDGSTVDIVSDGATLTMSDNSNYEGERGTAVTAAPTSITLAVDADGDTQTYYNGMSVLILTGTGANSIGIVASTGNNFNLSTKELAVIDWYGGADPATASTYEISEQGHHKENFSTIRKVKITLPGGTEVYADTTTPDGATLPISDTYAYTTGDGIFTVKLTVVPDYVSTYQYYAVGHTVYYNGGYYTCKQVTTAGILPTNTSYWTAITFDTVPVKYTDERKFYIDHDLREGRITAAYKARNLANHPSDIPGILKSRSFQNWQMLDLIIESMSELVNKQAWDEIEHDINFGKTIVAYNE